MAKLIEKYAYAKLKSVQKNQVAEDENWLWRKDFIGEFGTLGIFESEHKHPGERFAYLNCADGSWLKTDYGKFSINNYELTIKTNNSIYVFEIGREEARSWAEEKTDQEP